MPTRKKAASNHQKTKAEAEQPGSDTKKNFPVVGIGASAGGLTAFEAFFTGMPRDVAPEMAFVLVQHLGPDHKSLLGELLRRYTSMQVFEVEDCMVVQPNCIYIIPPNRDMAFLNGALHLLEPALPHGKRLPIDFFFRSLAQDLRERAICIVLSGTGSDGTLGARAIKGEGGMVMAQSPESSEYDGMPNSVIATGLVDYILPPAEMPARLIAYSAHVFEKPASVPPVPTPKEEDFFKKIFVLLRSRTGHDFSQYKLSTVNRRIERRMAVHQIEDLGGYVRYLQQTPSEIEALFRDLLIGVTNFFRDPEAFAVLQAHIIPRLLADKPNGATIRAWIPACSTGEEAYSLAILLQEQMELLKKNFKLQVYATDIDSRAISVARNGTYPDSIAADVLPERLNRFFTLDSTTNTYRIKQTVRDVLVFSEQDIVKDPPFSRLDLISCRNLLIYMGIELQKKLIPLFHYSLNPDGLLFLGSSESIGDFLDLFNPLNRGSKLYLRKDDMYIQHRPSLGRLLPVSQQWTEPRHTSQTTVPESIRLSPRELTERVLLQQFAPVSVMVTGNGDILYLHGRSGKYLEPAPGDAGMNIIKMAREGLRRDLTTALHIAATSKQQVIRPRLRVRTNGNFTTVTLTLYPVLDTVEQPLFLVVLEEQPEEKEPADRSVTDAVAEGPPEASAQLEASIAALKQELQAKEEYLQSATEELETSNEELKSANEELQSVNEELQSTNEELETSKEELQSVNEELSTVNNELQTKVADLTQANNDMNNLLAGTGVGTVFVDHNLYIQRFTPAVTQIINLIQTDVGRPVGHVVSNLAGYDKLVEDVQDVLNTLIPKEHEVQTRSGEWFLLRIRPYRTLENVIEGAVITFVDITELVRSREAQRRLAIVVKDSHDAITMQGLDGRILAWNPAAERMYGWSEAEALNMNISALLPEALCDKSRSVIRQLSQRMTLEPYQTQRVCKDGTVIEVWLTATALDDESGQMYAIVTTERSASP